MSLSPIIAHLLNIILNSIYNIIINHISCKELSVIYVFIEKKVIKSNSPFNDLIKFKIYDVKNSFLEKPEKAF